MRREYFREQAYAYSGAGLLCGGIVVALAAGRWASTLRRKHPQLLPVATQRDWEASWTPAARWTVGGLFVVLAATAVALSLPLGGKVAKKPGGQVAVAGGEATAAVKETADKTAVKDGTPKGSAAIPEKPATTEKSGPVPSNPIGPAAPPKVVALSEEEMARAWPCFRGRWRCRNLVRTPTCPRTGTARRARISSGSRPSRFRAIARR